jgi:pimeloyl-ACP methyl ester carboxylesterase
MHPDAIEPPDTVLATVQVGTFRIPYRRAGSGPPMLLLGGTDALFESLAARFRVFAPEGADDLPPQRLIDFLDGLGLRFVHLVAGPDALPMAAALALADYERVVSFTASSLLAHMQDARE